MDNVKATALERRCRPLLSLAQQPLAEGFGVNLWSKPAMHRFVILYEINRLKVLYNLTMNTKFIPLRSHLVALPILPLMSLLLLFVAAAMPYVHPMTPRLNSDLLAYTGLGCFGLVTHLHVERQYQILRFNGLSALCAFWGVWASVQYLLGIKTSYFSAFLISTSYLLAVILLTAWVGMWVQAQRAAELAHAMMLAVWTTGMVTALAIGLQMLGWQDVLSPWLQKSSHFPRQGSFLGQPNLAASLMSCAMVCLVFLFPNQANQAAKPSLWRCLSLVVLLFAMYGASSRTGYLEVLALGALFALFRKRFDIHWVWVALPVWLLLVLGVGEGLAASHWLNAITAEDSIKEVTGSGSARIREWRDALHVIESAPWWGVGWGQLQLREVLTPSITEPVAHAHNLFLQIQVELGLVGSAGLLAFLGHVIFKTKPWQTTQGFQVVMLGVAMVLGLHSMLEYPLWHALHLFLFGFALALLPGHAQSQGRASRWPMALAVAMLALTAWVFADHRQAVSAYENFVKAPSKEALREARESVWWNRLLFDSIAMLNTPVTADNRDEIRRVAFENANVYSQEKFPNLPLLKVMVLDGEDAIANRLAWRMCRSLPPGKWSSVEQYLAQDPHPRFRQWLAQMPSMQGCETDPL